MVYEETKMDYEKTKHNVIRIIQMAWDDALQQPESKLTNIHFEEMMIKDTKDSECNICRLPYIDKTQVAQLADKAKANRTTIDEGTKTEWWSNRVSKFVELCREFALTYSEDSNEATQTAEYIQKIENDYYRFQELRVDFCSRPVKVACPSGHEFGFNCIETWLSDNATCPICRAMLRTLPSDWEDGNDDEYDMFSYAIPEVPGPPMTTHLSRHQFLNTVTEDVPTDLVDILDLIPDPEQWLQIEDSLYEEDDSGPDTPTVITAPPVPPAPISPPNLRPGIRRLVAQARDSEESAQRQPDQLLQSRVLWEDTTSLVHHIPMPQITPFEASHSVFSLGIRTAPVREQIPPLRTMQALLALETDRVRQNTDFIQHVVHSLLQTPMLQRTPVEESHNGFGARTGLTSMEDRFTAARDRVQLEIDALSEFQQRRAVRPSLDPFHRAIPRAGPTRSEAGRNRARVAVDASIASYERDAHGNANLAGDCDSGYE